MLKTPLIVLTLVAGVIAAGCGDSSSSGSAPPGTTAPPTNLTVALDWYPNPDHVGLFSAMDKGMFAARGLTVQTEEPSDVSDPIKLVAAGRADVGISYEPEMFFAQQKDTPVVAVAALVPRALNSIIANTDDGIRSVADLKGKTIGEDGSKSTAAYLDTVLDHAGIDPDDGVHSCQRRFQPGARAARREGRRGDRRVPEHRGRAAQGGGHAHDHLPGRPLRRAVV